MIVVSDTTPLRHLIAIGEVDLLRKLYGTVIVPATVMNELRMEATPPVVKLWLERTPAWLEVRVSRKPGSTEGEEMLDAGELAAIGLAMELRADLLLMDDREGRQYALRLGLPVTGKLGVLERADVTGLLPDLPGTLADLESSGFYHPGDCAKPCWNGIAPVAQQTPDPEAMRECSDRGRLISSQQPSW